LQTYGKLDSKFRFIIVASKRAKQLLKGAKVKVRSKSRNPIRLAQLEVKAGLIDFDILQSRPEDLLEADEQVFTPEVDGDDVDGGGAVDEDVEGTEDHDHDHEEGAEFEEEPEADPGEDRSDE
jgi:DNA-directed RNA polymerase subunit K/omega